MNDVISELKNSYLHELRKLTNVGDTISFLEALSKKAADNGLESFRLFLTGA